MAVRGVSKSNVLVAQDGALPEIAAVVQRWGLRLLQNKAGLRLRGGAASDGAARIAMHYKYALSSAFELFPTAQAVVVVEDDLLFSPDFFEYLLDTAPVLEEDPTAFVVSAWSDNGFKNHVKDTHALRRTDYFPGLGWLLTRKLYKTELEPRWPSTH
ncbi:glycosyl transferase, partial [Ochromonadaceae sp. CCMP2298]